MHGGRTAIINMLGYRRRIMALSNAERKKRHRERVKDALVITRETISDELASALIREVRGQYLASAQALADQYRDDPTVSREAENALHACASRGFLAWQDVLRLAADAGRKDWTEQFEREMFRSRRARSG